MRGAWRFASVALTAGLLLAPVAARAQDAGPPTNSAQPADTIGPRELQNFSLSGNVTRPADRPPERTTAPAVSTTSAVRNGTKVESAPTRPTPRRTETAAVSPAPDRPAASDAQATRAAAQQLEQVTTSLPAPANATPASVPLSAPDPGSDPGTLTPEHGFSLLPWLFAAIALVLGGGFLFWRNRMRPAYVGGPDLDLFAAPEPKPVRAPSLPPPPTPAPTPAPRAAEPPPPAAPRGIVSTGLRPWIEIGMQPLRCIVTDDKVTFEFDLDLFNSGNGPARATHVAAVIINAGSTQDQQLEDFFGQAAGPGERIDVIQPLKRVTFTTQIVISRDQVQVLEMGERRVFVPLIAFNVIYGWGSKQGQTSVSYLLGREGKSEKLAPFRLDLGPRVFRGLGARPLPKALRK